MFIDRIVKKIIIYEIQLEILQRFSYAYVMPQSSKRTLNADRSFLVINIDLFQMLERVTNHSGIVSIVP